MRKLLLSLISIVALGLLAGCGDHHNHIAIPTNPTGGNPAGFSNASLAGSYVFAVHGINNTGKFAEFAVTGSFTADGNGSITSGIRDTVDDLGHQTLGEAITGTYAVNADGRGQAVLNGPSGRVIYRFVLESPVSGKLFQDGTTSDRVLIDAVGTLQAQTTFTAPTGSYIVRLDGEDINLNLFGAIGGITFTGSNINGSLDENDNGIFDNGTNVPLAANGTLALSGSRGSASLTENGVTHHFVVYFVSPTQLELLSTDTDFFLHGEAEAQSSFSTDATTFAAAAPEQVFSLSGNDLNGPRVEIGRMTLVSDGTLANAIEDISTSKFNAGLYSGVSLAGSNFAVGANGRWTASLLNPSGAPSPTLVGWQVSPQRSLVLTSDSNILETGTMLAQTLGLSTANVSGDFAEALSGFNNNLQSNFELTGNLRLDGLGGMQGAYDSQDDSTGLNLDVLTSGSYSIDPASGRTTNNNVNSNVPSVGSIPAVIYAVDAQHIEFLPSQVGEVYSGTLVAQAP